MATDFDREISQHDSQARLRRAPLSAHRLADDQQTASDVDEGEDGEGADGS